MRRGRRAPQMPINVLHRLVRAFSVILHACVDILTIFPSTRARKRVSFGGAAVTGSRVAPSQSHRRFNRRKHQYRRWYDTNQELVHCFLHSSRYPMLASTINAVSSSAITGTRSYCPSAQRYSTFTFWFISRQGSNTTIPIVFVVGEDPVKLGLVASL